MQHDCNTIFFTKSVQFRWWKWCPISDCFNVLDWEKSRVFFNQFSDQSAPPPFRIRRSSIIRLLFRCCPSAILRTIISIIVYAVNG